MITNVYKPSTSSNGGLPIDFIFAKTSQFKGISYKVLSDHPLALETSDHYPVMAKLLTAKAYEDVLLPSVGEFPELPDNPSYKDHDDDFFSEDDRTGF